MRRSILIFVVAVVVSLAVVVGTMQAVRYYVNRIYGPKHHFKHHVTWLVK